MSEGMRASRSGEGGSAWQPDLDRLRAAVGAGPLVILTHDNPDPDALASGAALAHLLETVWGLGSRLLYCGVVERAENRTMLHTLTPAWTPAEELREAIGGDPVALVDTQPGAGNNRLPADILPRVVIDHHPSESEALDGVAYADVRSEVGSTVTMLYQYLEAAGVEPDPQLAAAMFYGLKTDTRGLSRGATPVDERVYLRLLSLLDREALVAVEQAGLSREYFRAFSDGLHAARVYQVSVVANLGQLQWPDQTAEMADLLIRLDGILAVLCMGRYGDTIHLSLRTVPVEMNAGQLIRRVIPAGGTAGGHGGVAGGQIRVGSVDAVEALFQQIEARFTAELQEQGPATPLLDI